MTRQCNKCKITKRLNDFSPDKRNKDGISKRCKACAASRAKETRKINLNRVKRVQDTLQKVAEGAPTVSAGCIATGRYKSENSARMSICNDLKNLTEEESELALLAVKNNPRLSKRWKQYEDKVFEEMGTASEMKDYLKLLHDVRGDIRQKHDITPVRDMQGKQEEILQRVFAASEGKIIEAEIEEEE